MSEKRELINEKGVRLDGRKWDELRPIKFNIGILEKADGSAYVEWGENKILVGIYGPREVHPKHLTLLNKSLVRCRYHMAPFSTEERKRPAPSRREIEISKILSEALEPAIFTELYPRTGIDVYIEVLHSNGGTRCAAITAASLALADAGIPMKDLVAGCAAGKINGRVVLDLSEIEDQEGEADLPLAMMFRSNEICLLQMDGNLKGEEFEKTLQLAIDGCKKVYSLQKEALKDKYASIKETTYKEDEKEKEVETK